MIAWKEMSYGTCACLGGPFFGESLASTRPFHSREINQSTHNAASPHMLVREERRVSRHKSLDQGRAMNVVTISIYVGVFNFETHDVSSPTLDADLINGRVPMFPSLTCRQMTYRVVQKIQRARLTGAQLSATGKQVIGSLSLVFAYLPGFKTLF